MPHRFDNGENLDMEHVNDDLEAGSRDVGALLDLRYTYGGSSILILDGVTNLSAAVLRQDAIRRPGAGANAHSVEVFAVEISIEPALGVNVDIVCSDPSWPVLTLPAGETHAISNFPLSLPASGAIVTWEAQFAGVALVVAGRLILHTRCDRGNQGTGLQLGYTPNLVQSVTPTTGVVLDTELLALQTAVNRNAANNNDLRCEVFCIRNLTPGSTNRLALPGGVRTNLWVECFLVAAVGSQATFTINDQINPNTVVVVNGAGVAALANGNAPRVTTTGADPMNQLHDTIITIQNSAGAVNLLLAYVYVWWQ